MTYWNRIEIYIAIIATASIAQTFLFALLVSYSAKRNNLLKKRKP